MMKRRGLLLVCLVTIYFSPGCVPSPVDVNATVTAIAADVYATQTAVPPTPTVGPIHLEADGSGQYATLAEAARAASEGAALILGPGSYRLAESLEINTSLHLVGAGMDQTEIVSKAEGYAVLFSGAGPFSAEGVAFRHQGQSVADVVIVEGGAVSFVRCRFTGAVSGEGEDERAGLWLRGAASGLVQDCVVEGNGLGVRVSEQAQPALKENFCTHNGGAGIVYSDDAGGVASGNECSENGVGGIVVAGRAGPVLEGNLCADNGDTGIAYLDDGGGAARQNECLWNGLDGISVGGRASPTLTGNVCMDNGGAGIAYADSAGGAARQNECAQNGRVGIFVAETAAPDLGDNDCDVDAAAPEEASQ